MEEGKPAKALTCLLTIQVDISVRYPNKLKCLLSGRVSSWSVSDPRHSSGTELLVFVEAKVCRHFRRLIESLWVGMAASRRL